jgi:hypothetical protein
MVSGEIAMVVPQGRIWSLAPTVIFWVVLLGRRGYHLSAGDGGIPVHAASDDDVEPAQQRRRDRRSGLTIGEPIVLAAS